MRRKIYNSLLEWKNKHINTPLMVIGARQIGKTYIINEFCKNEFPNYVYINLFEQPEIVEIFEQRISTEEKFNKMQLFLDKQIDIENTIIFFDEIQESEMLISSLKYFCENERPFKIICAGSLLGVKVNRFKSSFPVGKVRMLNMYPMDFEEFLLAFDCDLLIKEIQKCYAQNQPMDNVLHEKLLSLYRLYLCVGGMPDAIKDIVNANKNIFDFDSSIISNIITAYLNDMNKYVTNVFESAKIETIYKSIPSQLGNNSNKFQYSKIDTNARSRDYETALNWLVSSSMVYKCTALNSIMVPPKAFENANFFKLYISDVGILTSLLGIKYNEILLDNPFIFKGVITENYVLHFVYRNNEKILLHSCFIYYQQPIFRQLLFCSFNQSVRCSARTLQRLRLFTFCYHTLLSSSFRFAGRRRRRPLRQQKHKIILPST